MLGLLLGDQGKGSVFCICLDTSQKEENSLGKEGAVGKKRGRKEGRRVGWREERRKKGKEFNRNSKRGLGKKNPQKYCKKPWVSFHGVLRV